LLRMHATEAESEGLATFGGGIGSMLPMQRTPLSSAREAQ
jgi:hypothetical protein